MRTVLATVMMLALVHGVDGQGGDKDKTVTRYGIDLNTKKYPQNTPQLALGSVLKAIADKQTDYLLAHLADPEFVDRRVARIEAQLGPEFTGAQKKSAAFNRLTKIIADNFVEDPTKFKELQRFQMEGEWSEAGPNAEATVKNLQARRVFMKQIAPERWVLLDKEK